MKAYAIVKEPIHTEELIQAVTHPDAGAINVFVGTVREMTKGKKTLSLEYAAYEKMAEKKLEQIGEEIQQKNKDARVTIHHRIGHLDISDIAVVIAVSTPHRDDAFTACRYAIERIKEIVPIWKKEIWEDGESWIGDQKEIVAYPAGKPEIGGDQVD